MRTARAMESEDADGYATPIHVQDAEEGDLTPAALGALDLSRVYVTPFLDWAGRLTLGQASRKRRLAVSNLRQRAVSKAAGKWNKQYLRDTDVGVHQLKRTAMEVLDTVEWNWQCMTQLQESEDRTSPAATT